MLWTVKLQAGLPACNFGPTVVPMAYPRTAGPPRRSQAERTETMRARLLDATIACLAHAGYGAMSTNDVVRLAKVSRGALAHHFPTKADLVAAAARRLLDERAAEFRSRFAALAPQERTPERALEVLWSFYRDPTGVALIELTVAARHLPELQRVLAGIDDRISANTAAIVGDYFPALAHLPFAATALRAVHALYAGLVLGDLPSPGTTDPGADVRALIASLVTALNRNAAPSGDTA